MVSDSSSSKPDDSKIIGGDGGTQIISKRVREAIDSIKEAVGNHPDADIYDLLQESNMDPNETAQKLLYKDPFHEVKRKKDKKKENMTFRGASEPRKVTEQNRALKGSPEPRKLTEQNSSFKGPSEPNSSFKGPSEPNLTFKGPSVPRRLTEHTQGMRTHAFPDRYPRKSGYIRNSLPDAAVSREFRVVRDNRVNQNTNSEVKPDSVQSSTSARVQAIPNVSGKSTTRIAIDKRHIGPRNSEGQKSSQAVNGPSDFGRGQFKDTNSNSTNRKGVLEESRPKVSNSVSLSQGPKPHSSQPAATLASNNTVVGLYSSASDPVHVPSNSRSSGSVGAIRREVGVVGIRRQSSENSAKHPAVHSSSVSTPVSAKDISSASEPSRPSSAGVNSDQLVQTSVSAVSSTSVGKSFLSNQPGGKSHQQPVGHQKASQPNMEWKPKSSQKSSFISPVVIGTGTTQASPPNDNSTNPQRDADHLQEKLSQVTVSEIEHVFIPQHLRVPEADRTRLTFGSFGLEVDNTKGFSSGFQGLENQQQFNAASFGAPSASNEDVNHVELLNSQVRDSGSASPASTVVSEQSSLDNKESSSSPGNVESYADIGMVRNTSPSYTPAEPQQQQDPSLPSFAAYDSQSGYDMPYYRPLMDESARNQSVPTPGEALSSHVGNSIPASSVAMVQQQTVQQLYPQMHVSHFPNFMPYRQYISPVYVPPMGVPGYSSNPAYSHPSNGNSYLLMPGGSSHLAAGGVKYGAPQYKPIPAGTPTGFGSYSNPTGYALNTQGTVGGAIGLDDSTRMKYKDGNLYVPNPQAETSEIWIQTPREIPGLQSAPYYNIPGQPPHAAYLPSHTGHASFNGGATPQPAHMQFPGLYHPSPQQAGIASPHHMVPNMGSNVGVGMGGVAAAAPGGAQIGTYQQPQIGHLNWNTNF